MKALSESRSLRLFTFGALYAAQGFPWGFISVGYVVFLTDQGLSGEDVGKMLGLAYLPWAFKILWGPLLDRFVGMRLGRRRPFIIAAEFLMGLSLLALIPFDPVTQLGLISAVLFFHNTVAALQDVAVDALAVDLLEEQERGRANAIMWACKSAGVAVGGSGGLLVAKHLGWSWLFGLLALSVWLVMLLPIFIRERPVGAKEERALGRFEWKALKKSFTFATPWWGVAVALLTPMGYAMASAITVRMFRAELELSKESIATLSSVDPFAGAAGALLGGFLADKLGARRAIASAMVAIAVTLAAFGALPNAWGSFTFLMCWTVAYNLAVYAYSSASLGLFMGLSNPAIGATHFATYMAATNLCYSFTSPLAGEKSDLWGYSPVFLMGAVLQIAFIPLLRFANPDAARARFRVGQLQSPTVVLSE